VIIAELTYKNPNISKSLAWEFAAYDLRGVRQILYQDKPSGYEKLADDIKRYVDSVLKERKKHAAARN
jgi:hypothetical protein